MGDLFGVAVSPFDLAEWQQATGIEPDLCMVFEHWHRQRALTDITNKAKSFGHRHIAITWEPWQPTPVGSSSLSQGRIQYQWHSSAILAGKHDDYIDAVADSLRDSKMTVYVRFAHEMNGTWYPWSHGPEQYVEAWHYVRNRVRSIRKAWNVQFIWSPNPDLWRAAPADWLAKLMPYWPGGWTTEAVGFTMIDFGGTKFYPVSLFAERFALSRQIFKKPIMAMEVNVARENAAKWLTDLATYVRPPGTLPLVIFSQGSSRAAAAGDTGDLAWSPVSDPATRALVKQVVEALHAN